MKVKKIIVSLVAVSLISINLATAVDAAYCQWELTNDRMYTFKVKNKPDEVIRMKSYTYENYTDQKLAKAVGYFYYEFPDGFYTYGYYDSKGYVRARLETVLGKAVPETDTGRVYSDNYAVAETPKLAIGIAKTYYGRK